MPGCLPLIAAILMQKFPGSVKLTCPEKQSLIRRRLENWKHTDLVATGYIYNLYYYIWVGEQLGHQVGEHLGCEVGEHLGCQVGELLGRQVGG